MILFGYAILLAIGYHLFVRFYEEPTLRGTFGEEYVRYCAAVARWLPQRSTHVAEIIELADDDAPDICRSRSVEQEVMDILDEPSAR